MQLHWKGLDASDQGLPTVLCVDGVGVARLHQRTDGTWFIWLDYHRLTHVARDCSSYDGGRAGAEVWARRHEARLAEEAAAVRQKWIKMPGYSEGPPATPHPALPVDEWLRQRDADWGIEIDVKPRRPRRRR